ncbi:MAG: bifunctional adenosylcobinamide kinase/adenosylcobinamide-phosphate guanylyltransferase [Herpetosiphon sp.]
MSKVVLFTGGARSGKSRCAEQYAAQHAAAVLYLATGAAGDDEMQQRIALHRSRRPADWRTRERPSALGAALVAQPRGTVVLLDCLTLLVSNLLFAYPNDPEPAVDHEIATLLVAARERELILIVVTNEVGMGIVPEHAVSRLYRDLLGRAAQQVAAAAAEVYLVVAGMPVEVRSLRAAWASEVTA